MFNRYFKPSALGLNDKEINRIHERANRGFAESMFKLAIINLDATFGIKDNIEAKKWLQQAAKLEYAPAMLELAYLYLDDRNPALKDVGMTWLERGATLGNSQARNLLRFYQSQNIK